MFRRLSVLVLLALAGGCGKGTSPTSLVAPPVEVPTFSPGVHITGTALSVRGQPEPRVFVTIATVAGIQDSCVTDSLGAFHLRVPASGDSALIHAVAIPDKLVIGGTNYGFAWVVPDRDRVVDVVLKYFSPI